MNLSIEPSRRATYRAATRGLSAYTVALIIRDAGFAKGVDFRGDTKRGIEDAFATADGFLRHVTGEQLRSAVSDYRGR